VVNLVSIQHLLLFYLSLFLSQLIYDRVLQTQIMQWNKNNAWALTEDAFGWGPSFFSRNDPSGGLSSSFLIISRSRTACCKRQRSDCGTENS
jgi:hypothetical protein